MTDTVAPIIGFDFGTAWVRGAAQKHQFLGAARTLGYVLLELQDYEGAVAEFTRASQIAQARGLPRATVQ